MPRPRNGPLLSRQRIIEAALELVDRDGLDRLSMRRLAAALSVDPMSIYHHVPNKDALLRALVETVFARMPEPAATGTWQEQVRAWAAAYRSVAAAHPHLVLRIVSDPASVAIAAVRVNEPLFRALEASGYPAEVIVGAADVLVDFVNGHCLALAAPLTEDVDAAGAFEAELEARPAEFTAAQRRAFAGASVERDGFGFGLDVLLGGIEVTARGDR